MKICIYAHSFPPIIGGAQTYLYNLAKGLTMRGHNVLVLTGQLPTELLDEEPKYANEEFQIVRIPNFREYSKLGVPLNTFLLDSFSIISKFKPDLVYSNGYSAGLAFAILNESLAVKHVFSYHATPEIEVKKIAGIWKGNLDLELAFTKFVMRRCNYDAYIACSKHYINFVKEYLNPQIINCYQIYYGVDMNLFSYQINPNRFKFGFSEDDFIILAPIRLIERKGIFDLLNAICLLKNNGIEKRIKLLIPSSKISVNSEFKKRVDSFVSANNLEDSVKIEYDKYTIKDMPELYAISDVVTMPSYSEGLGIALLEALAMKKPVVATDIKGIREVIYDGDTGILVPIKSPDKLANAFIKIYSDKEFRDRLTFNGYEMIKNNFELNAQIDKVEKLFKEIIT